MHLVFRVFLKNTENFWKRSEILKIDQKSLKYQKKVSVFWKDETTLDIAFLSFHFNQKLTLNSRHVFRFSKERYAFEFWRKHKMLKEENFWALQANHKNLGIWQKLKFLKFIYLRRLLMKNSKFCFLSYQSVKPSYLMPVDVQRVPVWVGQLTPANRTYHCD